MKTKEEIEQLAEKAIPLSNENIDYVEFAKHDRKQWVKGYTQCQEDNKDKKYTEEDMIGFFDWSLGMEVVEMICNNKTKQEIFQAYINSLNKQH